MPPSPLVYYKGIQMSKYLIKRILHGLVSVVIVVMAVMLLIYSAIDKSKIFMQDPLIQKKAANDKIVYRYQCWEEYGYLTYITYADWLNEITEKGELDPATRDEAVKFGKTAAEDTPLSAEYVKKFTDYYENQGYTVERLDVVLQSNKAVAKGGAQKLFAYKNVPIFVRMFKYFTGIVRFDNKRYAEGPLEGERGLTFTWHDPAYGGEKFSPAVMGNGTKYRYLIYFDDHFPYFHQNLITINLGKSYTINKGIDVWDTMIQPQGSIVKKQTIYPTGFVEDSANDMHTLTYSAGSRDLGGPFTQTRYTDDYTIAVNEKNGLSKMGYSFIIGILSSIIAYLLGIPLGLLMSRYQDKLFDKIGTLYIIFIMAVPSLAYIFMFRAIGIAAGWPITFDGTPQAYILPIISLALPSIGGLMKWSRRYMIDQKNADYVKFARSGGLSEGEIFRKHILKNAMIIIVQGIPGTVLFSLVGAIITERVYTVPGTGGMLVNAVTAFDNSAIVGVALFYALLSVTSLILGDVLMATVDPRISFTSKGR